MAADTRATGDFIDAGIFRKIDVIKKKDRYLIIGSAGGCEEGEQFIKWLKNPKKRPVWDEAHTSFVAIVFDTKTKELLEYGTKLQPFKIGIPNAVGSGGPFAMAAMYAGAKAEDAVKIAKRLDVYTGGKVQVVDLKDPTKIKYIE